MTLPFGYDELCEYVQRRSAPDDPIVFHRMNERIECDAGTSAFVQLHAKSVESILFPEDDTIRVHLWYLEHSTIRDVLQLIRRDTYKRSDTDFVLTESVHFRTSRDFSDTANASVCIFRPFSKMITNETFKFVIEGSDIAELYWLEGAKGHEVVVDVCRLPNKP